MKKGFTLIELLAVIVILAIIALIAVPIVINIINDANEKTDKETIQLYADAITKAVLNYYIKYPEQKSVTFEKLSQTKLIKYKGNKVDCDIIQIEDGKIYLNDCSISGKKTKYYYGKKLYPAPVLSKGLTPIKYDEQNAKWIVADKDKDDWYNYDEQKWANAVTLLPGVTKNIGDEVKVDGTEVSMMLVWIPRYEYKYTDLGKDKNGYMQYAGGSLWQPGEIKVNFISKDTNEPSSIEYKIHPAFEFGGISLKGIWVGKFELSNDKPTTRLKCKNENCQKAEKFRVLPNVSALRSNNIANFYYGIRSIENTNEFGLNNIDTHMIKNSEWGAVAYLSQSKYGKYGNNNYIGKYKEIYMSCSENYITGMSNGSINGDGRRQDGDCEYDDMSYEGAGKGFCGPGASTTGNIYGIYDMSGNSSEYVMGVYGESKEKIYVGNGQYDSGFDGWIYNNGNPKQIKYEGPLPNPKYYDLYTSEDSSKACNNEICYGHALSETSGWYNDYNLSMINETASWLIRGNHHNASGFAGVFSFQRYPGYSSSTFSTRVVFTLK